MMVGSKVDYNISNLYIPKDGKEDNDYQKSFSATLTIIVRNKDGKIIKRHKQKSHSPTANFIGLMLPITYYANTSSSWTLTSTSNTTESYSSNNPENGTGILYPNTSRKYADYLQNIEVGSGSQSNPYNAYNLALPIANGSGTGQLLYSIPNIPTGITINGIQAYFIISQSYANESGITITISEVGLIIGLSIGNNGAYNVSPVSTLVWYDVLSSPISVANGQQVVIYYTFSVNA